MNGKTAARGSKNSNTRRCFTRPTRCLRGETENAKRAERRTPSSGSNSLTRGSGKPLPRVCICPACSPWGAGMAKSFAMLSQAGRGLSTMGNGWMPVGRFFRSQACKSNRNRATLCRKEQRGALNTETETVWERRFRWRATDAGWQRRGVERVAGRPHSSHRLALARRPVFFMVASGRLRWKKPGAGLRNRR